MFLSPATQRLIQAANAARDVWADVSRGARSYEDWTRVSAASRAHDIARATALEAIAAEVGLK